MSGQRLLVLVVVASCSGGARQRVSNDGPADDGPAAISTVSVDRDSATADGIDVVTMTAHIVDGQDVPIAGCAVAFTVTGSGNVVTPAGTTDATGTTTATLASAVAETKTITAAATCDSDAPVEPAGSVQVSFVHGPITQLVLVVQPHSIDAGVAFSPAISVAVEDTNGNLATDATGVISLALAQNANGAVTTGTTRVAIASGVATFDAVSVRVPGQGYRIVASSPVTAAQAISDPFDVVYGSPSSLSTLSLVPASVPADGLTPITATVLIVNDGGVGLPGVPVALAMAGASGDVFPKQGITDATGRFVSQLTATVAGTRAVTATTGTLTLAATATFTAAPCMPRFPGLPTSVLSGLVGGMFAGDFDGDGHRDLAIIDGGQLSIERGVGDGTLRVPYEYPGISGNLVGADLDGDGHLDLVAVSASSAVTLMGTGDGHFTQLGALALPSGPGHAVLGDLDGDGKLDLIVRVDGAIATARGMGDGTFSPTTSYSLGVSESNTGATLEYADVTRDGRPDVITSGASSSIVVFVNHGDGTLEQPPVTTAPQNAFINGAPFAVADFDGDGIVDIVAPSTEGAYFVHGNGDATFSFVRYLDAATTESATVVDFDHDGRADVLATASPSTPELRIYRSHGDGTFDAPKVYAVTSLPSSITLGDFDSDGNDDVVVAPFTSSPGATGDLAVVRSTANGTLIAPTYDGDVVGSARRWFVGVAGDFNGDGTVDLLAYNEVTNQWTAELSAADGSLTEAAGLASTGKAYAAGDFTQDGKLDLLFASGSNVGCARGNGDGTFQAIVTSTLGGASDLVDADFNNDGIPDVAGASFSGSVYVALGNGDCTFSSPQAFTVTNDAEAMFAGDLDHDGNIDLVVSSDTVSGGVTVGSLSVLVGNGDGTFKPAQTYPLAGAPRAVTAGDFDGDGKLDLAVGNAQNSTVSILRGHGDATFDPETLVPVAPSFLVWLRAVDVNGDGIVDLLGLGGGAVVLGGNGDGTFRAPLRYSASDGLDATIADFNNDGRPDLMIGTYGDITEVGFAMLHDLGCR